MIEKHTTIPADAAWNETTGQWEQGLKNTDGTPTGTWQAWHPDGHRCETIAYGNGTLPFTVKRYHPDGTLSVQGTKTPQDNWTGLYQAFKSLNPTPEKLADNGGEANEKVWSLEFDYNNEGLVTSLRFFDRDHNQLNMAGDPQPPRPATVPEGALQMNRLSSANGVPGWIKGQYDPKIEQYTGEYAEWDMNGTPTVKRVYDLKTAAVLENHEYSDGHLWVSKVYQEGLLIQTFYHSKTTQPREAIYYRHNNRDVTKIFFDPQGNQTYSVRWERTGDHYERRYYNDQLVYHGVQRNDAGAQPGFTYYNPDGSIRISYHSNDNNTGYWTLFDNDGTERLQYAIYDEQDLDEYKHWNMFSPSWGRTYAWDHEETDWEAVIRIFEERYNQGVLNDKVTNLQVPAYIQAELDKTDWKNVETAFARGADMPEAINGLFADDPEIVEECYGRVWNEIEHQGSVYESTYLVAEIIAAAFPHYQHTPATQHRLFHMLDNIISMHYLPYDGDRYAALRKSLVPLIPAITQLAENATESIALKACYFLYRVASDQPATEAYLLQQWHNTANDTVRRAYAILTLGYCYMDSREPQKVMDMFPTAFQNETHPFLRLVLALHLIVAFRTEAEQPWLDELTPYLAHPEHADEGFQKLVPFVSGNVLECVLTFLNYANPGYLEAHLEPVIDIFHEYSVHNQEPMLRTIFANQFSVESSLENITPIRKKILLLAAQLADKHMGYINFMDIYESVNLPYDSYKLRQLAGA